jgi:hypothetical protein
MFFFRPHYVFFSSVMTVVVRVRWSTVCSLSSRQDLLSHCRTECLSSDFYDSTVPNNPMFTSSFPFKNSFPSKRNFKLQIVYITDTYTIQLLRT